ALPSFPTRRSSDLGEPGNRVALARTGRMLDQVTLARPLGFGVGQQLAHHVQLMEAREDLLGRLLLAALVDLLDYLGVVFQNVGEVPLRQIFLPKVIGLQAMRVRWVARAIVPALVERQEP